MNSTYFGHPKYRNMAYFGMNSPYFGLLKYRTMAYSGGLFGARIVPAMAYSGLVGALEGSSSRSSASVSRLPFGDLAAVVRGCIGEWESLQGPPVVDPRVLGFMLGPRSFCNFPKCRS